MNDNNECIIKMIKELCIKVDNLEKSHLELKNKLNEIHKDTQRMDNHINFVEHTYNTIKTPFHFLMNKVKILSYSSVKNIPSITTK